MSRPPKLVFIGAPLVGKTSLVLRISNNYFSDSHTMIDDESDTTLHFNEQDHPVRLFDTMDDDFEYEDLRAEYLYYADGIFVIYSISDRKSFDDLDEYMGLASISRNGNLTPIVLVGNKCDLESERKVTTEEGKAYAEKKGLGFFEVSAKTPERVDEMIQALVERAEEIAQKTQNSNGEKKKCFIQ